MALQATKTLAYNSYIPNQWYEKGTAMKTSELIQKAIASLDQMPDSPYRRILHRTMPAMLEAFTEELLKCEGEALIDFAHQYPRVLAYYMKTARASLVHSFESLEAAEAIEDIMSTSFSDAMDTASKVLGGTRDV